MQHRNHWERDISFWKPRKQQPKATLHGPIPASNDSEALDVHLRSQGRTAAQLGLALIPASTGPKISSAESRFNKMSYQVCHSNSKHLDQLAVETTPMQHAIPKSNLLHLPAGTPPPCASSGSSGSSSGSGGSSSSGNSSSDYFPFNPIQVSVAQDIQARERAANRPGIISRAASRIRDMM